MHKHTRAFKLQQLHSGQLAQQRWGVPLMKFPRAHLLRQLLRGKLVKLHHLAAEVLGILKALTEQHHLRHERIVRYHHGHGTEERLRVCMCTSA